MLWVQNVKSMELSCVFMLTLETFALCSKKIITEAVLFLGKIW